MAALISSGKGKAAADIIFRTKAAEDHRQEPSYREHIIREEAPQNKKILVILLRRPIHSFFKQFRREDSHSSSCHQEHGPKLSEDKRSGPDCLNNIG